MQRTDVVDESGTSGPATGTRLLARSVGAQPAVRFRHLLRLSLPVPAGSGVAVVDATLRGAFVPLDHDALHPPAQLEAASTRRSGPFVALDLPGPRRVLTIALPAAKAPSGSTVELRRLDGDTPSGDATVTSGVGGTFVPSFVDVRFAVGVLGTDSDRVNLQPGDLQAVRVRSQPSGATLDVTPADPLEPAAPAVGFWRAGAPSAPSAPGSPVPPQHATPDPRAHQVGAGGTGDRVRGEEGAVLADEIRQALKDPDVPFDAGSKLVDALRRVLADGSTQATIVLEADAPCAVRIDAFSVTYRAVVTAFEGLPAEDQVLRFDGTRLTERSLVLRLPEASAVSAATVRVRSNLRPDRVVTGSWGPLGGGRGVELVPGRTASAPLSMHAEDAPHAVTASGVLLALLPLSDDTSLLVSVQEDRNGAPSGADLVQGTATVGPAGEPAWCTASFAKPVSLSSAPYWVVVRTAAGRAVWLADPGDGPASVAPRVAVLVSADGSGGSPLTVLIGDVPIPASGPSGDAYDITDASNTVLAAAGSRAVAIPVRFVSASSGTVTVAPPILEFDGEPGAWPHPTGPR